MAGAGVTAGGLSLLGFGIAAVDVMQEQGAGGVTRVVAGAALAVVGLLFTNWSWPPWGRPSRRQTSPDQEEPFEMEGAEVTHAATAQGSTVAGAPDTPGGQAPTGPAPQQSDGQETTPADGRRPTPGIEAKSQAPLTDPKTPDDVRITTQARIPETDPTLGIKVNPPDESSSPKHRLVVLGDSLSQGFQSLAMFNTDLSYPAIIARELGCYESFRHPEYLASGGLPLNLEYLAREMERRGGVTWWEEGSAASDVDDLLEKIRHYWQEGPGCVVPSSGGILHNLAIPGCDIRDLMTMTADAAKDRLAQVENARFRDRSGNAGLLLAHRILASARDPETKRALTAVEAATVLGNDDRIETLIVFIGVYNAIGPVLDLQVRWSCDGYDDPIEKRKQRYNMWRPTHFEAELDKLVAQICSVNARHVIWATVPHVTIMPIARGVGGKTRQGSRYFAHYTRPWVSDEEFDSEHYPHLTSQEARAIDSAIDQYNDAMADKVRNARKEGRDWLLIDVAGLLDRLAARRYGLDQTARPPWWEPYELPDAIARRTPAPDSRFFASSPEGRTQGGLFSLDGVHLTTTGYAILAREFINVMADAGVVFPDAQDERREQPAIDFSRIVARDTLISKPPRSITQDLKALGWTDERLNWVAQLGRLL